VSGDVLLGPTALLVGARDAYGVGRVRRRDLGATLRWPGTWRVARRFWRTGIAELATAVSRRAFVASAARYVPELTVEDVTDGWAGIRAQAVARDGRLVDDFVFDERPGALHVRNAPSPAATSALAIAALVADRAGEVLGLRGTAGEASDADPGSARQPASLGPASGPGSSPGSGPRGWNGHGRCGKLAAVSDRAAFRLYRAAFRVLLIALVVSMNLRAPTGVAIGLTALIAVVVTYGRADPDKQRAPIVVADLPRGRAVTFLGLGLLHFSAVGWYLATLFVADDAADLALPALVALALLWLVAGYMSWIRRSLPPPT
jgi:hypothetical protein